MEEMNFNSPEELLNAYSHGFVGAECDEEDTIKLLSELKHPEFGDSGKDLFGSGIGKLSIPYMSLYKFHPNFGVTEAQTLGDCVAHSTRNAVDVVRAVQIDIEKRQESFVTVGATEAIYASRGHTGEGMSCSVAARFVNQTGGVLLRKNYPDLGIDLTRYNGIGWNRQWLRGLPQNVINEARNHQVKTTSLIRSIAQARDAIANGYAVSVCSNVGFNSRRDQNGIAAPNGTWYHAMALCGCDDTRTRLNETLFLVVNSWGRWNAGPRVHNQPEGSFWIRQSVAERMLAQQGSFVFSNFDGFPAQQLPDYGFGGWL